MDSQTNYRLSIDSQTNNIDKSFPEDSQKEINRQGQPQKKLWVSIGARSSPSSTQSAYIQISYFKSTNIRLPNRPVSNSSSEEFEEGFNHIKESLPRIINEVKHESPSIKEEENVSQKKLAEANTLTINHEIGAEETIQEELNKLTEISRKGYGEDLYKEIKEFCDKHSDLLKADPYLATTIHQLYDKAAEKLIYGGNIKLAFEVRSQTARAINFSESHVLYKLDAQISAQRKVQSNHQFGAHFSRLDTGILKGGNISVVNRNIDNASINSFHFKLSRFARRDIIQKNIEIINGNRELFEKSLSGSLRGVSVSIKEIDHSFKGVDAKKMTFNSASGYTPKGAKAIEISFEGVGKVIVGNSKSYGALYNDVHVEIASGLPQGEGLKRLHEMLTTLAFGPIVGTQRPDDKERIKLAQLFRAFYPSEAIKFETRREFYEIPVDKLRKEIENQIPGMRENFKTYLDNPEMMREEEIYPGKSVWSVKGISDKLRDKGAWGLMSGVYGKPNVAAANVALMIKDGALSSQDRFEAGLFKKGVSSNADLASGGGDQVFTRILTDVLRNKKPGDFPFSGTMQVLYDLDAVNKGSYGYPGDEWGIKNPNQFGYYAYKYRNSLMDLVKNLKSYDTDNEIMVKNRIGPNLIRGVLVKSEQEKNVLIAELKNRDLITNENGKEYILGKPIDKFISIGDKFDKTMWEKPENLT